MLVNVRAIDYTVRRPVEQEERQVEFLLGKYIGNRSKYERYHYEACSEEI